MGLMIFHRLSDAIREGYELYDRTPGGYLVRTRTPSGWALALVVTVPEH
ncbi:MAG: hypothetical protein ACXWNK_07985 [Vulcanimicrobiaceae bacterium]